MTDEEKRVWLKDALDEIFRESEAVYRAME